uniref:Chitin deacetylase 6 n=1 Tax=Leptinotarsa decemlineata TaxID=7539 RepID=A0A2Z4N548_LEPDE|nr:chitin deacetylase 6 [Leptinotarsa decemlineata]
MKFAIVLSLFLVAIEAVPSAVGEKASVCSDDECTDQCRCSSAEHPLPDSDLEDIPQLISLTFNEALTEDIVKKFWKPLFFNRANPDGVPIGATFFVPHEYTNYKMVNDVFNLGFEVAVHSITDSPQIYWRNATEEILTQEFDGQKKIISKFANIPTENIIGVRTPQLQLAGNISIKAYQAAGLQYDSSWPTTPIKPLFPYTLDYLSTQECNLGNECPNEAFPDFWILPINDLNGNETWCNTMSDCNVVGTADQIADWLTNEVDIIRNNTKLPMTLIVNSNWFDFIANSYAGFEKFLNRLQEKKDVFLVSQKQVLDWMKNPVTLSEFKTESPSNSASCHPVRCTLDKDGETRYMDSCVACPKVYPWLGNPDGDKK